VPRARADLRRRPLAVDILEAQIAPNGRQGYASQSIQMAPMDAHYLWRNDTAEENPGLIVFNESITKQSASARLLLLSRSC